jgi:signal transduction histidine kinase
VITNTIQVRAVTLLAGTPSLLVEKTSQILSNMNAPLKRPGRRLAGYALTSANDIPSRDPSDWHLLGSNDGGKTWETVDVRRNEIFPARLHRRVFKLNDPATFAIYRLLIRVDASVDATQLAEVEPMYADQQADSNFSLLVSASGENAPMEKTEMAFDHSQASKWLCFDGPTNRTAWIQWQCIPKVEDLPLINLGELSQLQKRTDPTSPVPPPGKVIRTLIGYGLVSANDEPSRDPRDWRLFGSNDGGNTWQVLDVRRGEKFPARFQKRVFTLTSPTACVLYRFEFESVLAPTNANSIQLAEIEPEYADAATNDQYSVVVGARADNAPYEGMENLFDGNAGTKWLDPAEDVNCSSWVQWYSVSRQKNPVIRADSKPAVQPGQPETVKIQMDGVAVCQASNLLGILDRSGFQMFQFETPLPLVAAGNHVRLNGLLRFGKEYPLVQKPELIDLGAITNVLKNERKRNSADTPPFVLGSAEGRVVAVSEAGEYSTLRLAPEIGASLEIKIYNPQHVSLSALPNSHLRLRGVIEPVFDEKGRQSPGVIWVAGLNDLTVVSQSEGARPRVRLPETNELSSIHQILEVCNDEPGKVFNVKVRGIITYIDLGISGWYLQDGPDAIYVQQQYSSGLNPYLRQEGLYVELQGTVGGDAGLQIVPSAFVKILGKGRMPEPLQHSLDYLVSGIDDGKWVQLSGVVTACEEQRLTLRVVGGSLMVWLSETDWKGSDRLLGSLVRVSGVCAPLLSNRNQRFGVRLLVPSADWIEIVQPSPEKPFDLPIRSISSLFQSNPRAAGPQTPLRKITGMITYAEPGMVFVQTNSEALRVYPREEVNLAPGDIVEVVGLAEVDGLTPKMTQALIKKTGRAALPAANPINLQQLDSGNDDAVQDGTRGWAQATLVGLSVNGSVQILELVQETTKVPFRAYLPRDAGELFSLPIGSRIRLEGAFKATADTVPDFGQVVTSFEMYLNSQADIVVLERPSWWTQRHTLWVFGGLGLVLFAALTWIWSLRTRVHLRTRELQAEISERKRMELEVEKTHKALLDTSRQAGMAEVATSVLHNVGNVLNSVNVASSIVADNLHKSCSANLGKVVALINEHSADLGAYVTSDPKGRLIPSYLGQLSVLLEKERTTTLGEVDGLRQNIEHIKQIVARQQSYARVAGVTETVNVAELVEEALSTNAEAMNGSDVTVVRDYDPKVSKITVDKHKALQILVNVFCNARNACNDAGARDKQITVRVGAGDRRVKISVCDNGVGISGENLAKIFNHGFTTRKNGHGFGLHSGALAARELGGTLTAHSEGQGLGSTFTLELPLEPAKAG